MKINIEEIELVDGCMHNEQKIRFINYAIERLNESEEHNYGICGIYHDYFCTKANNLELIPELLKYKPKKVFYDYRNGQCEDPTQFWFPLNDAKSRLKICKAVLEDLKS